MTIEGELSKEYVATITQFVNGEISACQFELKYLDMFKNETKTLPDRVFDVLNQLFTDVDSFCSDPELRDDEDLDEAGLLQCARIALEALSGLENDV